jgi:glycerophosphoryl diester phosphodiesterase
MKKISLLIVLALFLGACLDEDFEVDNLSNDDIFVIGHGGAGFRSPTNNIAENSMKSLELAIEGYNADGVEVDVQMTKDSQLVLYHDDHLFTKTSCEIGGIWNYNWAEIKNCRYKKQYFGGMFVDEELALLDEVLAKFSQRQIIPQIHLDVRYNNFNPDILTRKKYYDIFTRKLNELYAKYNAEDWMYCGALDLNFLKQMNEKNDSVKLFLEGGNVVEMLSKKQEQEFFGIVIANADISKGEVQLAHDSGVRIAIFNLKALPANIDAVEKSPDYIITDNVTLLQDILR